MSKVTEKAEMAGGLALIGGLVAGFAGLVAALVSISMLCPKRPNESAAFRGASTSKRSRRERHES